MHSTADELVGALDARGVPFLTGGVQSARALALTPTELLLGLARDQDARVRLAVIPLLLRHPEFAAQAQEAAARLSGDARRTFELFYTAARLLQQKYSAPLDDLLGTQPSLPDLFSGELGLVLSSDVEAARRQLAERHAALLGLSANWAGTYEHAAKKFIRFLELRAQWTRSKIQAA